MQSISQEWIDNQSAIIRKPGFIVVNIPDVKISCGAVSHRVETVNTETHYISDPLGCDYLDKCGISVTFNTTILGSNSVKIVSLNDKSEQLKSITITASSLTSGSYYWETTGFSKIKIICKTASVTDIQLYAYGIPRADIQSYTHSRSYDPIGFELPTNDISIDIYNYRDKYTDFYKGYSNEGYLITVYYGYKFDSKDEIILGGTFHLTDVQLVDDILTLTGENLLTFVDEKASINLFSLKANESGYIHLEITDSSATSGATSVSLSNRAEFNVTAEDLITYLRGKGGISISCNSDYTNVLASNSVFNASYLEMCQSLINLLLHRCYIDRYDVLHYDVCTTTSVSKGNHILLSNCLGKPTYSSTKKVKKFEISTDSTGKSSSIFEEGESSSVHTQGYSWVLDTLNNKVMGFSLSGGKCIYYIDLYPEKIYVYYRLGKGYVSMTITYASVTSDVEELTVDTSGTICDINSPLGRPSDTAKIVNYFSNRDLYTFNVRGNPARDVGDYVNVSLTNDDDPSTYKKGLVLSSILSYDGSFKEECTVRIIENDFE